MKAFYLFFLLCTLCYSALAQSVVTVPRKTEYFTWQQEAWLPVGEHAITYNSRAQITHFKYIVGGIDQTRDVYTYNGSFMLQESVGQGWNTASQAWYDRYKTTYTQDAQGRVSTIVTQSNYFMGPLENTSKTIYTYTGSNANPSLVVFQKWVAGNWVDESRHHDMAWGTTALGASTLLGYVEQVWTNNAWVNHERHTTSFNPTTRQLTETIESANGASWVNLSRAIITHDVKLNRTHLVDQRWENNAWAFAAEEKYELTYNGDNVLSERVTLSRQSVEDALEKGFREVFSDFQTITINGSAEQLPASALAVFPNPATDALTVSLTGVDFKEAQVELYTLQGQKVYDSGLTQRQLTGGTHTISTSHLAPGMYLLHVRTNNHQEIARRILKN